MQNRANTAGALGQRITSNQIYPFLFPPKRLEENVHAGCFTNFARRPFSKRKYFNGIEEEIFLNSLFKGIQLKKYWDRNIS
jgi:hypothetical protein